MNFDIVSYLMGKGVGGGTGSSDYTITTTKYNLAEISNIDFSPKIDKFSVIATNDTYPNFQAAGFFSYITGVNEVELTTAQKPKTAAYFGRLSDYEKITIHTSFDQCTDLQWFCGVCPNLKEILGEPLDFSANTAAFNSTFAGDELLETVRFVPSCINRSLDLYSCPSLSDDSVISIANGLDETATGYSLRLYTTQKTRCGLIVGVVSSGLFVQDDAGTMTLTDFITTVKGWTLA